MAVKQLFIILICFDGIIFALNREINDICPSYETLYPCFCNFMQKYNCYENIISNKCHATVITCIGNEITTLKKIFNQIAHYNQNNIRTFEWFYLVDLGLYSLENNLFENIYFENVYLQNCPKLLFINEYAFGNQSRLYVKNIYINASMLSDHPKLRRKTFKALSLLKNLHVLEIQASNFFTIPYKAFNRFTDVKIIRFYNPDVRQKLTRISSKSFYRASKVTEIDLKNNQISHISSYAFYFQKPSNHEVKIYLSGNSLHSESFEPNAFDGSNGRRIILYLGDYDNCNLLLKTLKQNVFETFLLENKQNTIDMYGCPLVCDHQMDWLLINGDLFKNQIRNLVCYNKTNLINTETYEYYHVTQ